MSNTYHNTFKEILDLTKKTRAESMPNTWDRKFAEELEGFIADEGDAFMFEAMDMKTIDMVIGYAISVLGNYEFRVLLESFIFHEVAEEYEDEMDYINERAWDYPFKWKEERVAKAEKEKAEGEDFIKRMSERFFDGSSRPLPTIIELRRRGRRFWNDLDHRKLMRTDHAYSESHGRPWGVY